MSLMFRCVLFLLTLTTLTGCMGDACDEFAAPSDRVPKSCAPKPTASQLAPQDPNQPSPTATRYCYSSLAQEECYATPQPGHQTGYLGPYQPAPVVPPAPTPSPASPP